MKADTGGKMSEKRDRPSIRLSLQLGFTEIFHLRCQTLFCPQYSLSHQTLERNTSLTPGEDTMIFIVLLTHDSSLCSSLSEPGWQCFR